MATRIIGETIASRYHVEERLGVGAMGAVFRARHVKIGRTFAIKVLHPSLVANQKFCRRFEREAEVAATLEHPNVIGVVDIGETPDGLRYIVMEYADGVPLSRVIEAGPLEGRRMIRIARQLLEGLQHAHEAGLIHRDFKPDNVIVARDKAGHETPRIVDFGIALQHDEETATLERERLTTAGIVLGTPHYMAPEHASGEPIDHRIDLFALGVICFEMLTGKLPFDGDGVEVARANMTLNTPPMGVRAPDLDVDPLLEAFTRKLMARDRDARPPTAKAARELLDLIEHDLTAAAIALGLELPAKLLGVVVQGTPAIQPLARKRAPGNTLEPSASTSSVMPAEVTELVHVNRPGARIAISVTVAALVVIIALVALTTRAPAKRADPEPVASLAVTVDPPSTPSAIVASSVAPTVAPGLVPVVTVPPHMPARPISPQRITTKAPSTLPPVPVIPPTTIPPPPPSEPTAAAVAEHYASIGRALKRLSTTHRQDATLDLWPRYRSIRINAAIATRESRIATTQALDRLAADIDTRAK